MQTGNISGRWKGVLMYGEDYGDSKGKHLAFEMELSQVGTKVKGVAHDVEGEGVNPDSASIQGRLQGNKLVFTKRYDSFHFLENGQTKVERSRRGPKIYYHGDYDHLVDAFYGTWTFEYKLLGFIRIGYMGSGTWSMGRIS
jgi:hypothetical protein